MDFHRCTRCDSDRFVWHGAAYVTRQVVIDESGVAHVAGPARIVRVWDGKGVVQCAECGASHQWLKNVVIEDEPSTVALYQDGDEPND